MLANGCSEDRTVTTYFLQKVDPKESYGHEWLPLNPTTYKIVADKVVSEIVGILTE